MGPANQVPGECKQMTSTGVCPVRTSSLPLFVIFLLLNSLLNRLHSPSHESGNIGKDTRAPVSVLEPKFSLHKWAHGYTCSYRDPRPICSECVVRPQLWQCVGRTGTWGIVLVDLRPASLRAAAALRLAKNAELVVVRGGEPGGVGTWPADWLKTRQSTDPKIAGRRVVVDRKSSEWTLMIEGDLDRKGNGSAFAKAVNMLSQSEPAPNILLTVAALATRGDILELGTSVSSSPLLHRIAEAGNRGMVSADTDSLWLLRVADTFLASSWHQYVLVPVYEDYASCGRYFGAKRRAPALPRKVSHC